MASEPSTLELLRSRLADLEERQRAAGGVAEAGFWQLFSGRMPSAPSQPAASEPGGRGRVRAAARVAPEARVASRPRGAWAGWSAEQLEAVDLLAMPWLDMAGYEEMVNDPVWIESIEAHIEARSEADASA
ncbi:hypothetical protein ACXR8F_21465, partial [Terrabacter sp. AAH1]